MAQEEASSSSSSRKRSSRACDGCKQLKCEDIRDSATTGESSCKLCREFHQICTFTAPVRKRGPAPGFRRRSVRTPSAEPISTSIPSERQPTSLSPTQPAVTHEAEAEPSSSSVHGSAQGRYDGTSTPPTIPPTRPESRVQHRRPLLGLPPTMVDELLAVYFTHVHNVWPLIYKPLFNPHVTSAPLLLSMLAIAACVAPSATKDGFDGHKLFRMAESSLHHCRMESRVDIVQAMILMSLRQTGNGDKGSAFLYAGRACTMVLNLGLNLAPSVAPDSASQSQVDDETRSRVFWNCYVLDKSLAEETGRSFLLPYRRCTTPLPSHTEVDELETWPPLPMSSAPLPKSVRHVVPRRGYVVSCFVWTCRLAMIVEEILSLQAQGPPISTDPWDQQFAARQKTAKDQWQAAEELSQQLKLWRQSLPRHLDVNPTSRISPLPHHVVGLAWYTTANILLHSRFIQRRRVSIASASPITEQQDITSRAHAACSEAAQETVDLLRYLDQHKLLGHVSSDIIHILSLATLFEAFDSTDTNPQLSQRAKDNFSQCCIWLRDFSSSWPAASAHKLFFEAVIQGGMKLSSNADEYVVTPSSATLGTSPSMTEGIQAIRRTLSIVEPSAVQAATTTNGPSTLLQLPQYYWNHLQGASTQVPATPAWEDLLNFTTSPEVETSLLAGWDANMTGPNRVTVDTTMDWLAGTGVGTEQGPGGGFLSGVATMDQAEISSALMRYMMDAAKVQ
ncbi:hypothetical protein EHS25_009007 [Saitozyma podzolica]|uniref:Xylanolytic transcriptional activator regulatory domain-containing protein n=1 Tax=Saitozyma podzolica TaxID=1890683 RepID=A0A427YKL5_9TREE|nr:hypothetical protein EHS25_009007 [Saitozyma podzolica]